MTFLWLGSVTFSKILIFSNLKFQSSILAPKSVHSLFEAFMFLRNRCAKFADLSIPAKILLPDDNHDHPHPFTWKINFPN